MSLFHPSIPHLYGPGTTTSSIQRTLVFPPSFSSTLSGTLWRGSYQIFITEGRGPSQDKSIPCLIRSGVYVVEQHGHFPDNPLPDPLPLRQDLASCVTKGVPECQFIEGEYMAGRNEPGHRRQMSQFCGQERFCGSFNSQRAMIAAMVR